jgi:hypothetical protein
MTVLFCFVGKLFCCFSTALGSSVAENVYCSLYAGCVSTHCTNYRQLVR